MLLTLLESEHYCTTEELLSRYRSQYSEGDTKPKEDLEELTEAFVTIKGTTQRWVEWIHPSYRDLVIEQLRDGGSLKSEFLHRMNVTGVKLALSDTGGSTGRRRFPLVTSSKDWDVLRARTLQLAQACGVAQLTELLTVLANAMSGSAGHEVALSEILRSTCQEVRAKWDSEKAQLDASAIEAFAAASEHTSPMVPMPELEATWRAALLRLRSQASDPDTQFLFWPAPLDDFLAIVQAIKESEPRLLRRLGFPKDLDEDLNALLEKIDDELSDPESYDDRNSYEGEADASFGLANSLNRLLEVVPKIKKAATATIKNLTSNANRCRLRYAELEEDEDAEDSTSYESHRSSSDEAFDINSVFEDL